MSDLAEVPEQEGTQHQQGPAWVDEEDIGGVDLLSSRKLIKLRKRERETKVSGDNYVKRLRQQHQRLNPGIGWANVPDEEVDGRGPQNDDDEYGGSVYDDDDLDRQVLQSAQGLLAKRSPLLPQGTIEITRLRDANQESPSNCVVQSVHFHPNGQLLLTAGLDKTIRFFQVDGKHNPKVQSVFLDNLPVRKAAFTADGRRVVAAGRRKWFHIFDIESGSIERVSSFTGREERSLESFVLPPFGSASNHSGGSSMNSVMGGPPGDNVAFLGNDGYILLASLTSRQLTGTLKMNGTVRSASFSSNGRELLSCGGDGEVYHWDLRTLRCFHRARDDGCVNNTALAVSPTASSDYLATASDAGVVNVYDRQKFLGGQGARPQRALMNLTTTVDSLQFSQDGQMLAMASRMKKDALRLVHLPTCTVFSNWPSSKTPLGYVHSLDFSPGGGMLATGNAKGRVLLFRLHHYSRA